VRDEAVSFVLGDLPGDARATMVAHLEGCGGCRREVADLNAALDSVSVLTAPVEPHPGFVDRVLAAADRDPALAPARPVTVLVGASAPGRRPVAVVMRRRRTLLGLSGITALLAVIALGSGSWAVAALAIFSAVLEAAYLSLIIAVTHLKARDELTLAATADESWWRELPPVRPLLVEQPAPLPEARVGELDLAHFVVSYFTGWLLMPVVAVIGLVRGDLTGVEQSPVLGRIVALQRQGRSHSLRLLVAGATTVAVAGGGTAMALAPGVASAATPAPAHSTAVDQSPGVVSEHPIQQVGGDGLAVTYLAQLNQLSEVPTIGPGPDGSAGPPV
jgi:hypothetical protein